jgi:hypothetical protein
LPGANIGAGTHTIRKLDLWHADAIRQAEFKECVAVSDEIGHPAPGTSAGYRGYRSRRNGWRAGGWESRQVKRISRKQYITAQTVCISQRIGCDIVLLSERLDRVSGLNGV